MADNSSSGDKHATLNYPGGEHELEIVGATEGAAGLALGSLLTKTGYTTFDPGYVVYSLGKLMMLKLRHDYQEQLEGKFSLRTFHDAVLAQGTAPLWAHRRLLLNDATDATLE